MSFLTILHPLLADTDSMRVSSRVLADRHRIPEGDGAKHAKKKGPPAARRRLPRHDVGGGPARSIRTAAAGADEPVATPSGLPASRIRRASCRSGGSRSTSERPVVGRSCPRRNEGGRGAPGILRPYPTPRPGPPTGPAYPPTTGVWSSGRTTCSGRCGRCGAGCSGHTRGSRRTPSTPACDQIR